MMLSRLVPAAVRPAYHTDDPFAATRQPFGAHLEDLRRHLLRALLGLGLIVFLSFGLDFLGYVTGTSLGVGKPAMALIVQPVEQELQAFHERRIQRVASDLRAGTPATLAANAPQEVVLDVDVIALARRLAPLLGQSSDALEGRPPQYVRIPVRVAPLSWEIPLAEAHGLLHARQGLAAMSVTEVMLVYFQVTLACGFVLASPWVFWQLWPFVAAGLYPHEQRYVYHCLPFCVLLFLAGVVLCEVLILPRAVETLLAFNEWLGIEPELRLNEWLTFALVLPLAFGLAFQTPLAMVVVNRLGLVSAATFRRHRGLAWFALAAAAAVMTPSVDMLSMLYLWLPLGLLYELGTWLCRDLPPEPAAETEEDRLPGTLPES
jgi:sec-independent protein translocase protein TatC